MIPAQRKAALPSSAPQGEGAQDEDEETGCASSKASESFSPPISSGMLQMNGIFHHPPAPQGYSARCHELTSRAHSPKRVSQGEEEKKHAGPGPLAGREPAGRA